MHIAEHFLAVRWIQMLECYYHCTHTVAPMALHPKIHLHTYSDTSEICLLNSIEYEV